MKLFATILFLAMISCRPPVEDLSHFQADDLASKAKPMKFSLELQKGKVAVNQNGKVHNNVEILSAEQKQIKNLQLAKFRRGRGAEFTVSRPEFQRLRFFIASTANTGANQLCLGDSKSTIKFGQKNASGKCVSFATACSNRNGTINGKVCKCSANKTRSLDQFKTMKAFASLCSEQAKTKKPETGKKTTGEKKKTTNQSGKQQSKKIPNQNIPKQPTKPVLSETAFANVCRAAGATYQPSVPIPPFMLGTPSLCHCPGGKKSISFITMASTWRGDEYEVQRIQEACAQSSGSNQEDIEPPPIEDPI